MMDFPASTETKQDWKRRKEAYLEKLNGEPPEVLRHDSPLVDEFAVVVDELVSRAQRAPRREPKDRPQPRTSAGPHSGSGDSS